MHYLLLATEPETNPPLSPFHPSPLCPRLHPPTQPHMHYLLLANLETPAFVLSEIVHNGGIVACKREKKKAHPMRHTAQTLLP